MQTRDRIKELRRVRASQLRPNPKNWRTHPPRQQDALRGVLAEIGYADALLARELPDGTLELIDGHLRAETTPEVDVPVLVLDVDAAEADKLLAVLDPLAGQAGIDVTLFQRLRQNIQTASPALQALLDEVAQREATVKQRASRAQERPVEIPESFQLVVECDDEEQQRDLFEELTSRAYKCRVLML